MQSGLYDYVTPDGYGDTFFQYAFEGKDQGIADGSSFQGFRIPVNDGVFLARTWAGLNTMVNASGGSIQIYDAILRQWYGSPYLKSTTNGRSGQVVLPEVAYPPNGDIRFDLANVLREQAGVDGALTVFRAQLVFSGVRRRAGFVSDPLPSSYKYYEKKYEIPYSLVINNYASVGGILQPPTTVTIPIQDFDFELRRVELALQSAQQLSQFAVVMYDNNWTQLSNIPILANHFFHLDPSKSSGEMNFNPSPPILYTVDSVLRFDVYSLLFTPTVLPQTFNLCFHGVRRIPC